MTIKLDTGAASITIQAPKWPYIPGEDQQVRFGRTAGGGIRSADLGDGTDHENPVLVFLNQSDANFTAMRDFIQDTLTLSKVAFTYTDPDGGTHANMHYVSGLPGFREDRGTWHGTLQLTKDMSA